MGRRPWWSVQQPAPLRRRWPSFYTAQNTRFTQAQKPTRWRPGTSNILSRGLWLFVQHRMWCERARARRHPTRTARCPRDRDSIWKFEPTYRWHTATKVCRAAKFRDASQSYCWPKLSKWRLCKGLFLYLWWESCMFLYLYIPHLFNLEERMHRQCDRSLAIYSSSSYYIHQRKICTPRN